MQSQPGKDSRLKNILVIVLLIGHAAFAATGPARADETPGPSAASVESVDPHGIFGMLTRGRPDSALAALDSVTAERGEDPLLLILRVRTLRDRLIDEDYDKSLIAADTEPIHAVAARAIEMCDRIIDEGGHRPRYLYYRGRAHMAAAELYTLTRSYWSAGRAAGRAKRDLEAYLDLAPGDPDASGDLGAFLYFADALPGVAKLISKLLFFPTGDRDRGLELLQHTVNDGTAIFAMDYEIALAAAYIIFEGRLDEGADALIRLFNRYPSYIRLAEPLCVLGPLSPIRLREFQRVEDTALARHLARKGIEPDWSVIKRMQFHRSYADTYFASPQRALYALTTLVNNPVMRPDWTYPLALLNQGTLLAMAGRIDEAGTAFDLARGGRSVADLRDVARGFRQSLENPPPALPLDEMDFIAGIYDRSLDRAGEALEAYRSRHGEDFIYQFYRGEWSLMRQDFVAAAAAYDIVRGMKLPPLYQGYAMFATLRLAEINGHEGRYDVAERMLGEALEFDHAQYLLNYTVRSRQRYYQLLKKGTLTERPSLLFTSRATPGP